MTSSKDNKPKTTKDDQHSVCHRIARLQLTLLRFFRSNKSIAILKGLFLLLFLAPATTPFLRWLSSAATTKNHTPQPHSLYSHDILQSNSIPQQKSLKTIVIVIGNLRGGEETWKSMYTQLLEPNNADLALVIGKTQAKQSSMYARAKYLYEFNEYEDWADAIDLINGTTWRQSVLPFVTSKWNWSGFMGGVKGIGGSGAIHFMARYFAQQLIREQDLVRNYDRFVITRSDHYYQCQHNLSLLDNMHVWVPTGEDYAGICDRHVVCNSDMVMKVIDVLPSLISDPDLYHTSQGALRNTKPEQFLKLFWEKTGVFPKIRRFGRVMFTLMQDGVDTTRGRTASRRHIDDKLIRKGLRVKYPHEYHEAQCTCKQKGRESGLFKYHKVFWSSQGWCLRTDSSFNRLLRIK